MECAQENYSHPPVFAVDTIEKLNMFWGAGTGTNNIILLHRGQVPTPTRLRNSVMRSDDNGGRSAGRLW